MHHHHHHNERFSMSPGRTERCSKRWSAAALLLPPQQRPSSRSQTSSRSTWRTRSESKRKRKRGNSSRGQYEGPTLLGHGEADVEFAFSKLAELSRSAFAFTSTIPYCQVLRADTRSSRVRAQSAPTGGRTKRFVRVNSGQRGLDDLEAIVRRPSPLLPSLF